MYNNLSSQFKEMYTWLLNQANTLNNIAQVTARRALKINSIAFRKI